MQKEDVRKQLIRQFPVEVVETEGSNRIYYSCPSCGRSVSKGMDKCDGCEQILSWKNINNQETKNGVRKAVLKFEVPADFEVGDCRRCSISCLGIIGGESVYECPLRMHGNCKLEIQ